MIVIAHTRLDDGYRFRRASRRADRCGRSTRCLMMRRSHDEETRSIRDKASNVYRAD